MPISQLELMEFFMQTIMQADINTPGLYSSGTDLTSCDSFFESPGEELAVQSCTMAELLAGQPNLLLALADMWEKRCDSASAKIVREIERFLAERADDLNSPEAHIQRLAEYVYPLV